MSQKYKQQKHDARERIGDRAHQRRNDEQLIGSLIDQQRVAESRVQQSLREDREDAELITEVNIRLETSDSRLATYSMLKGVRQGLPFDRWRY